MKGGNDYPLYIHPRVKGISVTDPKDTMKKVIEIINKDNNNNISNSISYSSSNYN